MSSTHPSKSDSKEHSTTALPATHPAAHPMAVWNKNPDPDWDRTAAQEEAMALYETCHEFELPGQGEQS